MLKNGQTKGTMRILVVDDSEDARDLIEGALLSAGYKDVVSATSAADAYGALDIGKRANGDAAPIDLILLDIVMPDVDGIEACARIRSDGRYGDIPIIMVTALADMDSLANAFMAGANDYINKPLNRIELLARVRASLKLKAELVRRLERERELLNFVSSRGDRRPGTCIDEVTGLFVGEFAEAYLTATAKQTEGQPISVITLAVDRLDACRAATGDKMANSILASVATVVRAATATVGVIAAAYRNGIIVVVAPGYTTAAAVKLAESMRAAVAHLGLSNVEAIKADYVTASLAVSSGHAKPDADSIKLLTQAINSVQLLAARGGGEVVTVSS